MKFIILLNAIFAYIHTYSSVTWVKRVVVSLCRYIRGQNCESVVMTLNEASLMRGSTPGIWHFKCKGHPTQSISLVRAKTYCISEWYFENVFWMSCAFCLLRLVKVADHKKSQLYDLISLNMAALGRIYPRRGHCWNWGWGLHVGVNVDTQ